MPNQSPADNAFRDLGDFVWKCSEEELSRAHPPPGCPGEVLQHPAYCLLVEKYDKLAGECLAAARRLGWPVDTVVNEALAGCRREFTGLYRHGVDAQAIDGETHKDCILRRVNQLSRATVPIHNFADEYNATIEATAHSTVGDGPAPLGKEFYEKILRIIIDAGKGMERHPNNYIGKDEEALRDYFVPILNSHFPSSTGETFNKTGKTDILIRHENHNVFVAECKYWSGPKAFHGAIDQLLGYLTWRDSKSAVILFVKNKALSSVIHCIEQETPLHKCFDKFQGEEEQGWLTFDFHLPIDPGQLIRLTVLVFHFPKQPHK